jgi:hypothetical protein
MAQELESFRAGSQKQETESKDCFLFHFMETQRDLLSERGIEAQRQEGITATAQLTDLWISQDRPKPL